MLVPLAVAPVSVPNVKEGADVGADAVEVPKLKLGPVVALDVIEATEKLSEVVDVVVGVPKLKPVLNAGAALVAAVDVLKVLPKPNCGVDEALVAATNIKQ